MASKNPAVPLATFREYLHYDPSSGAFTWRKIKPHVWRLTIGDEAGSIAACGYRYINACGVRVMAHRLAYFYMKRRWPKDEINHINGDRADNRWSNLEAVTRTQNQQRRAHLPIHNRTGVMGVSVHKCGKYVAQINVKGKTTYLGLFNTLEEGHAVYQQAKRKLARKKGAS